MDSNLQFEFIVNRDEHTLTVIREFKAERQLVWDCHTKSAYLEQWFAPKPYTAKTKKMDFDEGGYWLYAMISPTGEEHWGRTDYVSINPIDSYNSMDGFCDENGVINPSLPRANWVVTFADKEQHTLVTTVVTYDSLADIETVIKMGMEEGLTATLDQLDELLKVLSKPTKITIHTNVEAPIKLVWDYYTHPDHITHWNFANHEWQCPSASNDLKVGGKYRARMEAKDGSFGFDFEATYKAIDPGKSFTYTMPDNREVKVTFDEREEGTHVKVIFDAETQNSIEMQEEGWLAILNNFKKYSESHR